MDSEPIRIARTLLEERDYIDSFLGTVKTTEEVQQVLVDRRKAVQAELQQHKGVVGGILQDLRDLYQKMDDTASGGGPPPSTSIFDGARASALMADIVAKAEMVGHYETPSMPSTALDNLVSPAVTAPSLPSMVQPITEALAVGTLVPNPVLNVPDVKPSPRSEFDDLREAPQGPALACRSGKAALNARKAKQKTTGTTGKPTRVAMKANPKKGVGGTIKNVAKQPRKPEKPVVAQKPKRRQLKDTICAESNTAGASSDQQLAKVEFPEFDRHCMKIPTQCNGNRYACELCGVSIPIPINSRIDAYRHLMLHCDDPSANEKNFYCLCLVDSD
ncbi:hypothetical protein AAVH_06184 [Aphelenchoides avenae]|nr:hypothetical protein AAVH_06184 [Aphelenchus avenae]